MSARQKGTNSLAGDDEEMPDAAPSRHLSEPLQQCNVILKFLLDMAEAEPYSAPVDWCWMLHAILGICRVIGQHCLPHSLAGNSMG